MIAPPEPVAVNPDLGRLGARIDAFFVCPHRAEDACGCRKPQTGLLEQAAQHFSATPAQCVVIGDSATDVAMGRALGCLTVGVAGARGEVTVRDLASAVPVLLAQHAP